MVMWLIYSRKLILNLTQYDAAEIADFFDESRTLKEGQKMTRGCLENPGRPEVVSVCGARSCTTPRGETKA
jgi:hypothetical protein